MIAAFDEVVVLGYRESVNLAQIRTFTEMDSQEERIFNQIQIAQQRVAKNNMLEKAKEMQMKKKMGALPSGFQSGFGKNTSSSELLILFFDVLKLITHYQYLMF